MVEDLDIHNTVKQIEQALNFLRNGGIRKWRKDNIKAITEKNIRLILDYYKTRTLEGKSLGTRRKEIYLLINIARFLDKDFDLAVKEDLKEVVLKIDISNRFSLWTKCKLRLMLRQFYKWLKFGDDYLLHEGYPEEVRWIKKSLKKKDEPQISAKELITEEEMKKLIDAADHPRDKAFMSILTESGARIAEIGNLRIKDVYQDEFSYLIHIKGKTGERTDRVFYSDSYIANWLNIHPSKNNPEAPLWVNIHSYSHMKYPSFVKLINKICKKAAIGGRHYPHLFRHSRVTINARKGMSEPLLKKYFGWEADSRMLSRYSHLVSDDANEAILKMYGVKKEIKKEDKLNPIFCDICHHQNAPTDNFCGRCARPLNKETALTYSHYKHEASKILNELCDNPKFLETLKKFMTEQKA